MPDEQAYDISPSHMYVECRSLVACRLRKNDLNECALGASAECRATLMSTRCIAFVAAEVEELILYNILMVLLGLVSETGNHFGMPSHRSNSGLAIYIYIYIYTCIHIYICIYVCI